MIKIKDVCKIYQVADAPFYALDRVDLEIKEGEIIVVLGPSGSGKTTLLNVMSGLDKVSSGNIFYNETDITKFSDFQMTKHRQKNVGFIFQSYNLLEHLNVYENILVGEKLAKEKVDVDEIISVVGLTKHKHKKNYQLSGGEQQRVSIARALAKNPKVLFCDEPTGALDEETGKIVLDKLVQVNEKFKTTILIVTHNPGISFIADRIIKMNSGKIIENVKNERVKPKNVEWC